MVDKPTPKKMAPTPPPKPAPAPVKAAVAPAPAPAPTPAITPKKIEAKKVDAKERHRLIQEAAYFRSLKLSGGDPAIHWLAAEKEVDLRLK